MKPDYITNSHYLAYVFLFWKVGRMYFLNLGVKGIKVESGKTSVSWENSADFVGVCGETLGLSTERWWVVERHEIKGQLSIDR